MPLALSMRGNLRKNLSPFVPFLSYLCLQLFCKKLAYLWELNRVSFEMKKYLKLTIATILAVVFSSCSQTLHTQLTPTSGPLARQGVSSLPATFTYNGSGSGAVTVTMPDGEICTGRYSTIVRGSNSRVSGSSYSNYSLYPSNASIYGSTSYSGRGSTYSNDQQGRAIVTGNKGRVITINYVTSANSPTHGHGTGYDNRGNNYTIVY